MEETLYDVSNMFEECQNREIIFTKNFNDTRSRIFDKSIIRNMNRMLKRVNNLAMNFSFFNPINVVDMGEMFDHYYNDKLINYSFINTSSVTNMSDIFQYLTIYSLDFSVFNTKKVTDMQYILCII